jgi:hypothetical protein
MFYFPQRGDIYATRVGIDSILTELVRLQRGQKPASLHGDLEDGAD